jgi:DNA-binding NarL/FixJ family response regulator
VANLRIVLGDDHLLMRQGLRKILEERPNWTIVAEAGNGREAVRQVLDVEPDVAVLDIGMPLLNGIDATAQIVRKLPSVRVLMLSMHDDHAYITRAVRAGAKGYLLKDAAGVDLINAIDAVAAGKSFFSPPVAKVVLDEYLKRMADHGTMDRYDSLSEREREVFQLVAEGRSTKEIAELLSISPATVETHRAHILDKLDIRNTAELVLFAVRRGVIS